MEGRWAASKAINRSRAPTAFSSASPTALYTFPAPQPGSHEGGTGGYNRTPVHSYVPGPQYAAEHGRRTAQTMGCQNSQVIDQRHHSGFLQQARQ
jgi:hypothetical protein